MHKIIPFVILASVFILSACGAGSRREASGTGIYFDTVTDIKIYGENADLLLSDCFDICEDMEKTLSAYDESSELYRLNHRKSDRVKVSADLYECIKAGLQYSEISNGAFDITVFPVSSLWDFESDSPAVPDEETIKEALKKVDYRRVHCDDGEVVFDDPDTQIDLGGIAKGYISYRLRSYLKDTGCTSAIINLGGNVSMVGGKADGQDWVVGIQEPYKERGTVYETVDIKDKCVVSSGTYERYFTADEREYHHIVDPGTGYPAETDLMQATIIGEDDVLCDALSTICVLIGREASGDLIQKQGFDVDVLFIDSEHHGEWFKSGGHDAEWK